VAGEAEGVVDVRHASARWRRAVPGVDGLVTRAAAAAMRAAPPPGPYELSIALADDALMHRLNRTYRAQDKATNVLAFPAEQVPGCPGMPAVLGDVVVGHETAAAEAEAAGKPLGEHLTHLVVHGVLHLLGYRHDSEDDAAVMEALEVEVLAGLGIGDPYADAPPRRRAG
jgi:probable rRNA maturation factor